MTLKILRSLTPALCLSAVFALSSFSAHATEMQNATEDGGSGGGGGGGGSGPSQPTGNHGRTHHVTPEVPAEAGNSGHHPHHSVNSASQAADDPFHGTPFDPRSRHPRKLPTRAQVSQIRKTPVAANQLAQKSLNAPVDAVAQPLKVKPLREPASAPAEPASTPGAPAGGDPDQELRTQSNGGGTRSGSAASGI
ncbi:MAG: hypothetical protein H7222_10520 [Methylotenera sp.]|nr:hypothetical protein [Oligoflexia bacterium]